MLASSDRDTQQFKLGLAHESRVATGHLAHFSKTGTFLLREVQGLYKTDMAGQEWNALAGLCALSLRGSTQSKPVQPGHNHQSTHSTEAALGAQQGDKWVLGRGSGAGHEQGTGHGAAAGRRRYDSEWSCGDSYAWSQAVWIRIKLYRNLLEGRQNSAKILDCMSPLDYGSKDAGTQDQTGQKTQENL